MAEYLEAVCLPVQDQDRAKSFYTEVMGFKLVRDLRGGPAHLRWIQLGPEGAQTNIALIDAQFRNPTPVEGLVLKVDDLEAFRSRLQYHGLRPREIVVEGWGSHFSLDDPDGNKWAIIQYSVTE